MGKKGYAETVSFNIPLSRELWYCVDAVRGKTSRAAWIEEVCWKNSEIRKTAKILGIKRPERRTCKRERKSNV